MAPTTPWGEPTKPRAGDTWLWQRTFSDFPSTEGWTPSYAIRGPGALAWDAAWISESGGAWTVVVPADKTAGLPAGRYEWAVIMTGSGAYTGRAHTIETGTFEVQPDLEAANPGDRQTHAEKVLEVIDAILEGKVTADIESYMIGNRQAIKIPIRELHALRGQYRAERYVERFGRIDIPVKVSL